MRVPGAADHSVGDATWLVRRLDRMIPPELLREPGSQLRSRALVGSCFGVGALAITTLVVRVATVPLDGSPFAIAGLIAVVLTLPWLQASTRSHKIAGATLVGAGIVVIPLVHALQGRFPEPSLLAVPLIPLLAAFFVDLRFGMLSAALLTVVVLLLKLLLSTPSSAEMAIQSWTFATVACATPWMCVLLASAYERARIRGQHELQAANARSEQAFARAEAANRSKTEFLRHVSHELRTPLNAIIGFGELVQEDVVATGQSQLSADVAQICRASEQLLALINDLLDISRIEADAVDLEAHEVDLAQLLMQLRETARPLVTANANTLEVVAPADLPRVVTDERRLRQVLLNLISNACKFTERGQIFLTAALAPAGVVLSVRDTGVGMSPAQRARIFEPFVQVHPSARRRQQGTGLGLSLSRRLVETLGGTIEVTSEPGLGTEFTVRLPLSR